MPVKSRSRSLISFTTSKLKSKNITINLILYIYDTFAVINWPCWCLFPIIVKKKQNKNKNSANLKGKWKKRTNTWSIRCSRLNFDCSVISIKNTHVLLILSTSWENTFYGNVNLDITWHKTLSNICFWINTSISTLHLTKNHKNFTSMLLKFLA